ncbi:MAG: hypothetical protein IT324_22905 [Anaerolineae bacterium]|nr:hypothetical protein [Anaerolineae bacterium]
MKSVLTQSDYEDFLVYLYFGKDFLLGSIHRAFLDWCRTAHGLSNHPSKDNLYQQASNLLQKTLIDLQTQQITSSEQFDAWHHAICKQLIAIYQQGNYRLFIGQAQKWINMTIKYVYVLGEQRIPGFADLYPFCHTPLDNILLEQLRRYNCPKLSQNWSRIDDYNEYLSFQSWVRQQFSLVPLDVEFKLWMGQDIGAIQR